MERIKLNIQRFADNTVEVELVAAINEFQKAINTAQVSIDGLKKNVKSTQSQVSGLKNGFKELKSVIKGLDLSGAIGGLTKAFGSLYSNFITKSIDVSEELNLFNVVFNNIEKNGKTTFSVLGREATQFQNKLNEAFGTNKKETMRYQGLFQAMGESAGLDDETSALMSRNMTKLAYDLASLYNTTETKAAESLRAGVYAGQTKPLRNYGIDVTQTSYKPLMEELGLEKSVSELTQAEKEILRYISTLRQAQNAMGDFANTIESPANQLKVLRQQFYEMQAAIGNLFVGAFSRILPYANAIIMVVKEVAKTIASIFGIEMSDYNTGIATYDEGLADYSESLDGVAGSAGGASDAIKALKRQTLGFDQINNLVSPTPTSGSGGGSGGSGGVLTGIDDRLLAALKEYDNGMDKVKMKAVEIRDKIMDILGFTKHINAETGETYFTYDGWWETVKGLWNGFKELNPVAKAFVAIGVPAVFATLLSTIKKIAGATGITTTLKTMLNVFKNLLSPAKELTTSLISFSKAALTSEGGIKNLGLGLSTGIESWREQQGIIDKTTGKLNGFTGVVQGTKNVLLGLGEAVAGVTTLSASVKSLTEDGANMGNVLGTAGGTIMTVFGGVQAGAVFGPWGAAIGGVTAAIVALGTALLSTSSEMNKVTEETESYVEGLSKTRKENERLLNESLGMTNYHKRLVDQLKLIVDENGRVKEGYEDRAQFIVTTLAEAYGLELYYSDGIVQGYQDQIDSIDKLIAKEEEEIRFNALKEQRTEDIKNEEAMMKKLGEQYSATSQLEQEYYEKQAEYSEKGIALFGINLYYALKLSKADEDLSNARLALIEVNEEYIEQLMTEDKTRRVTLERLKGNTQEATKIEKESREESLKNLKQSLIDEVNLVGTEGENITEKWRALGITNFSVYQDALKQLPQETSDQIQLMTGEIALASPAVIEHFQKMGEESEEKMIAELKKLPETLQRDVIDGLQEKGAKIPEEIQKGLDSQPDPRKAVILEVDDQGKVQQKVYESTRNVHGSVDVGVNVPSAWEIQQKLQRNLNSAMASVNVALSTIFGKAGGGIFANGHWQPIQAYANGGLPSGGQLFMAREAGPELVGKIGRHTAVMNNNQIVDSVKAGVYEAVSAAMSQSGMGAVQIDLHTDEGVVVDRINRITRQTGSCPIEI